MSVIPVNYAETISRFTVADATKNALVVLGHDPGFALSADEIAEAVADSWSASGSLLEWMGNAVDLVEVTAYKMVTPPDPNVGLWSGSRVGSLTGNIVPPQVSMLIHKTTGVAGRRNRGRMYIPGAVEANIGSGGQYLSGYQAQVQGGADAFLAALQTNLVDMYILHNDPAYAPTSVSALSVADLVGTQRRRLR